MSVNHGCPLCRQDGNARCGFSDNSTFSSNSGCRSLLRTWEALEQLEGEPGIHSGWLNAPEGPMHWFLLDVAQVKQPGWNACQMWALRAYPNKEPSSKVALLLLGPGTATPPSYLELVAVGGYLGRLLEENDDPNGTTGEDDQ